jgi:aspartyl/asparaginyl-tRNA synthetase
LSRKESETRVVCEWYCKVEWGCDLQSEHERYLTEEAFGGNPVIVTDYPKEIKAFYMRENADGKTVAAMDLLVPRVINTSPFFSSICIVRKGEFQL